MKILAQLDRRLVPVNGTNERFLRVQVQAPDVPADRARSTRLPLNLALIIDRSGSMSGTKLEKAKEAAIFCLRNLTGADRAAIVAYDDEVRVVSPSRALTAEVKNEMISQIRQIHSGGSTNLSGGWLAGAQEVARHVHEANYLSRAIVLSDGLANVGIVDNDELGKHASELRQRGISTTTMGIGADFNEDLLEKMAIKGGGHFYFIEDARQIPDFLHRELGEVLSTCARKVTLEFEAPEGVHAYLLNTFEVDRTGKTFRVRLDDMIAGEVRGVVFRLSVRGSEVGRTLPLPLQLTYMDVESGETRTGRNNEAMLTFATDAECAREAPDSGVIEEVVLLQAAVAREEALKYDAVGDYAQSAARLSQAAMYTRTMAPASPAAMREAEMLEEYSQDAQQGLGAMKRKTIHYQKNVRQQGRKE